MRKLVVFDQVTLDGYFCDKKGDMSWAHKSDPEWDAFTNENASGGGILLFGRVTFEMMKSYWPTPMAMKDAPVVAKQMNEMEKYVLSKSLRDPGWKNTQVIRDIAGVRKLKKEASADIVMLGSGSVVAQLADEGLVDEYQIVVNPIVLGEGRTLFDGVKKRVTLELSSTREFKNGNVLLSYKSRK